MDLITTTGALDAACARFAELPFVTVDTSSCGRRPITRSFASIQMAGPGLEGVIVDPLAAEIELGPFLDLMADESVVKVFHSARQDVEIIWNIGELIPTPLLRHPDCRDGVRLRRFRLLRAARERPRQARIDKSSRFTVWSRRALSEAQALYAVST
jgi:ribonuclease D